MASARGLRYSYADYVREAERSVIKLEYYDGEISARLSGTLEHSMLTTELTVLIGRQLSASCRVLTSDARIVTPSGLATYPDLSVVCGELIRAPEDRLALANPVLLVEVLSPSTEDYDRGEKLRHYQQIPSLQTVLLVAHDARRVTAVVRSPSGWIATDHVDGDVVTIVNPALTLAVRDIYRPLDPLG